MPKRRKRGLITRLISEGAVRHRAPENLAQDRLEASPMRTTLRSLIYAAIVLAILGICRPLARADETTDYINQIYQDQAAQNSYMEQLQQDQDYINQIYQDQKQLDDYLNSIWQNQ
jgi:hypothetical protein